MNTGNKDNQLLKELYSKQALESTSDDFTDTMMERIEQYEIAKASSKLVTNSKVEHDYKKPLNIYFGAMGAVAVLVIIISAFSNSSPMQNKPSSNQYYHLLIKITDEVGNNYLPSTSQIPNILNNSYMQFSTILILLLLFYIIIESKIFKKNNKHLQ